VLKIASAFSAKIIFFGRFLGGLPQKFESFFLTFLFLLFWYQKFFEKNFSWKKT
jgi:hypothetical protein